MRRTSGGGTHGTVNPRGFGLARGSSTGFRISPLLEVLEHLERGLGVALDLLEDLEGRLLRRFRHLGGVLQPQAVLLRLTVTREQQHRPREGRLDAEHEVEEDERVEVPLVSEKFDAVDEYPDHDEEALDA